MPLRQGSSLLKTRGAGLGPGDPLVSAQRAASCWRIDLLEAYYWSVPLLNFRLPVTASLCLKAITPESALDSSVMGGGDEDPAPFSDGEPLRLGCYALGFF